MRLAMFAHPDDSRCVMFNLLHDDGRFIATLASVGQYSDGDEYHVCRGEFEDNKEPASGPFDTRREAVAAAFALIAPATDLLL